MVEAGDDLRGRRRQAKADISRAKADYASAKAQLAVQKAQLKLRKRQERATVAAENASLASQGLKRSFWTGRAVPVRASRRAREHTRHLPPKGASGEVVEDGE